MTRDVIIKMAQEAGFEISKSGMPIVRHSSGAWVGIADRVENFADLAVNAERQSIAAEFDRRHEAFKHRNNYWLHAANYVRARGQS